MIWAVLPLKDFMNAKQRLSGVLAPYERRALFQAMVEDVLQTLVECSEIDHILLVSDDPAAAMLAANYGATHLAEKPLEKTGLNGAVAKAATYIATQGVDTMLVIHGDIPLATPHSLTQLCTSHCQPGITIAPDVSGQGSNVMICSPPKVIPFFYGEGSCERHRREAQERGVNVTVSPQADLAIDVDSPSDLVHLVEMMQETGANKRSWLYLRDSGIASRVRSMGIDTDGITRGQPGVEDSSQ